MFSFNKILLHFNSKSWMNYFLTELNFYNIVIKKSINATIQY